MEKTRLEKVCLVPHKTKDAAKAVLELCKQIWKECKERAEFPGDIYGDAMKEAGFYIGEPSHYEDDRMQLAQFPVTASVNIAMRIRNERIQTV